MGGWVGYKYLRFGFAFRCHNSTIQAGLDGSRSSIGWLRLPPWLSPSSVTTRHSSNKFGSALAAPSVRASAIFERNSDDTRLFVCSRHGRTQTSLDLLIQLMDLLIRLMALLIWFDEIVRFGLDVFPPVALYLFDFPSVT